MDTWLKVYLQKYDLELEATDENLATVQSFVEEHLEAVGCSPRAQMQITAAAVSITFLDRGMPFDPRPGRIRPLRFPTKNGRSAAWVSL